MVACSTTFGQGELPNVVFHALDTVRFSGARCGHTALLLRAGISRSCSATSSPHLVLLGDSDGGLFGVLSENLDWFEPWLSDGLAHRAEAYGYGRNMFSATADELMRLFGGSLALTGARRKRKG